MAMMLTELHLDILSLVNATRPTIHQLCETLGKRQSTVSMIRNRLRDEGLIENWNNYEDRMAITPAGRSALQEARDDQ